jgi:hypothetical protein
MHNPMPLLTVWLVLAILVASYVIFRFARDRRAPSSHKQHPLYPFASNPGDGTFPTGRNTLGRVAYWLLVLAMGEFLAVIASEIIGMDMSAIWILVTGAAVAMVFGLAAWVFDKWAQRGGRL